MASGVEACFAHLSPAARALLERQAAGRATQDGAEAGTPVSDSDPDEKTFPLSFAQRRVWLFEQITPGTATYNRPKRIKLDGQLDVPALRRAVREIFRRHEVLRSAVDVVEGNPFQRVLPLESDYLEIIDFARDSNVERSWIEAADTEALRPFNLATGPLARCVLVRISAERHLLLFTASHLAFDGWSTGVLCREIGTLYKAFVAGRESPLPDIPHQYGSFATHDIAHWSEDRVHHDVAYWTEALRGAPPVVRLPREASSTESRAAPLAPNCVLLRPDLAEALRSVGRQSGATLFMTMFAAFSVLLSRLSGLDDIVIGVPVAGRLRPGTDKLLGFFANTLPVRIRPSAGTTFRALLEQVRQTALGALEHQELPFDVLVEHLRPERSLEHAPIVQTLFNFRNFSAPPLDMGDIESSIENVVTGASALDLGFDLEERPDGVLCVAEHDSALFTGATVRRWLSHYECILEAVASNSDEEITRLPLLTQAEGQRILVDWNSAAIPIQPDESLHGLIEQQVGRTPDAVALISEIGALTYTELNQRANRLANDLVGRGVAPDVLVGVCLERSQDMAIALLAVLKAGGAYVPLDPDYPSERLAFMLADCGAPILLTTPALAQGLPGHAGTTVHIDAAYWNRPCAASDGDNLAIHYTPGNLAYVMYTSGSTGRPKGAMNTHRGVCNFLVRSRESRGFGPADVVLANTPASFDTSVLEIFGSLACGARLVIARPGGHADPVYLCDIIAEQRVTVVNLVPSMLHALLDVPSVRSCCATLRLIVCGGEALTVALQERFFAMFDATLHNAYGPTETAIAVCDWRCERGSARRTVPIGRPLPNVHIYILDGHVEPTPIGVPGELHIGGVAVGRGYLNRPELTAERFISDPFSGMPGQRLYRTGDLARFGPDGVIEYLGRSDEQLKLRGVRIELGEIEAVLLAHPYVSEAAVITREDASQSEVRDVQLVAYIVATDRAQLSDRELRGHLEKSLPRQMIPSSFVLLDAFPLTPSGKLDRSALPESVLSQAMMSEYAPPDTPTEVAIAGVWLDLLGCERVGVHDNFFELGGHSLTAMRMASRVHALGMRLAMNSIFAAPTVAQLAALVDGERDSHPNVQGQPELKRRPREDYRRPASILSDPEHSSA